MDLKRVRPWEWICGASGALLIAALFLPWYQRENVCIQLAGVECPAPAQRSGWESFGAIDVALLVAGLFAIALLALTAAQRTPAIPVATAALTALVGTVAAALVAWRIVFIPEGALGPPSGAVNDPEPAAGAVAGLIGSLGVVIGAWLSMRDEGAGIRQPGPTSVPPGEATAEARVIAASSLPGDSSAEERR